MYLLLATHFLQFVFLRNFYDNQRRVNTKHSWVWVIHVCVYSYFIYAFLEHHNLPHREQDPFISRHVWIPMDICLSTFVFMYFVVYWATQEDIQEHDKKCHNRPCNEEYLLEKQESDDDSFYKPTQKSASVKKIVDPQQYDLAVYKQDTQ